MSELVKAIKNHAKDNVATLFGTAEKGSKVIIMDASGTSFDVEVKDNIPYGHKIALEVIEVGQEITKYGEEIGLATTQIVVGEHVHVQNIESIRGRGDWNK